MQKTVFSLRKNVLLGRAELTREGFLKNRCSLLTGSSGGYEWLAGNRLEKQVQVTDPENSSGYIKLTLSGFRSRILDFVCSGFAGRKD